MSERESRTKSELSEQGYDLKLKIMILGESMVGKTSVINRYVSDKFVERYLCTIGIDFQEKVIKKKDKVIKLQIWDTAGQERFRNVAKSYFQSSNGFIIAYSICDKESFNQVKFWLDQINSISEAKTKSILIGTKCDLEEREVEEEEGRNLADKIGINFLETSSKLNININEAFDILIDEILLNYKGNTRKSLMISSKKLQKSEKKNCC